jgi:predicted O-methyltransferase YrrM
MAFSTAVKNAVNRVLSLANLHIETLTESRTEQRRLEKLVAAGHFEEPVFPVPESFKEADVSEILAALPGYRTRFDTFQDATKNDVGFSFANDYFRSPDAEVFYTLIRTQKPGRIVEIGSGHSTKVARQAILDGKLKTRIVSIDPQPRAEIDSLADECVRDKVEDVAPALFDTLQKSDMLFIDSSHEVRMGNDGAFLYSTIVPRIASGVFVQIHDVFLPYDYPRDLIALGARGWNEQYIVQAMLAAGPGFDVIWPGYFVQRAHAEFAALFPHNTGERAQSLWLRKLTPSIRRNGSR